MNYNLNSQLRTLTCALALSLLCSFITPLNAAAPPLNITNFHRLDPPSVAAGPFGWSLDATAGKVLVGATGGGSGYAFIYDVATRHELFRLQPSDPQNNGLFGQSVALNADYALVSANQMRAAYIFDTHTGQQLQKFSDPNSHITFGFEFGMSTALSGNIAIIGDPGDDGLAIDSGAVYVYNITTGQLLRTMYINAPSQGGAAFGTSVAMEGNFIAIGAPGAPNGKGAVFVHDANGVYLRVLQPTGPSHAFGHSVEIAGNLAMVSDYNPSSAYLFNLQTGQQLRKFTSPNPNKSDGFGHSIAFDGHRALIGNWTAQINGTYDVGSAYLFDVTTGDLLASLQPQELHSFDDAFGYGVAMSGNTLIASALSGEGIVFLTTIPEPTSISLVLFSSCAAFAGRRKR